MHFQDAGLEPKKIAIYVLYYVLFSHMISKQYGPNPTVLSIIHNTYYVLIRIICIVIPCKQGTSDVPNSELESGSSSRRPDERCVTYGAL